MRVLKQSDSGHWQERAEEGAQPQVNGQKEEATSHPGLHGPGPGVGVGRLTDTGQALVQATGEELRVTSHPGVLRTKSTSKNMGFFSFKASKLR